MSKRFKMAMTAYALLALGAGLTLDHPKLRAIVWIILGGFAVLTWNHERANRNN